MTKVERRAEFRSALRDNASDLLAYLERRVHFKDDAADILSDTMLQAWRRMDAFPSEPQHQRMWLYAIAKNMLANYHRSRKRRSALADRLRLLVIGTATASDSSDANAVRDAVRRLPERQRELVMLIHWDGLTILEAAQHLGVNQSTARSRYAAARATLREGLSEEPSLAASTSASRR